MIDMPRGEGWWRSDDGKWYPPDARRDAAFDPRSDHLAENSTLQIGGSDNGADLAARPRRRAKRGLVLVLVAGLVATAAFFMAFKITRVEGNGMEPMIRSGDRVLVAKWRTGPHWTRRGEVIMFLAPRPTPELRYKIDRVIGLPGDLVTIDAGRVWVDGHALREPYLRTGTMTRNMTSHSCTPSRPCRVPAAEVWVLGDNRSESQDSRTFGYVKISHVTGQVLFVGWPPHGL